MNVSAMLGMKMEDKITGFRGIVTGYCVYITGCNQALLTPRVDSKGAKVEGQWHDEQRLERVGESLVTLDNEPTSPRRSLGFDKAPPIR